MKDVTNVLYDFVLPSLSVGVGVTIKPLKELVGRFVLLIKVDGV